MSSLRSTCAENIIVKTASAPTSWTSLFDRNVDLRRKPWSVPRLRGRGEQGKIAMHATFLPALYFATLSSSHTQESSRTRCTFHILGLAYHALASEARSNASPNRRFAHLRNPPIQSRNRWFSC